jgi:hypothetical protein
MKITKIKKLPDPNDIIYIFPSSDLNSPKDGILKLTVKEVTPEGIGCLSDDNPNTRILLETEDEYFYSFEEALQSKKNEAEENLGTFVNTLESVIKKIADSAKEDFVKTMTPEEKARIKRFLDEN